MELVFGGTCAGQESQQQQGGGTQRNAFPKRTGVKQSTEKITVTEG